MQVHFFGRYPSALLAYELGIFDDIGERIKVFSHLFFLPGAKFFCLFGHFIVSNTNSLDIRRNKSVPLISVVPFSSYFQSNYDTTACK
jgi:hypothetical protein